MRRTWLLLFLLTACVSFYYTNPLQYYTAPREQFPERPPQRGGQLLLGKEAVVHGSAPIAIEPPRELDGMTREQVFELRRAAVKKNAGMVRPDYEPSSAVFGQIADGAPWWGMQGEFFHGAGERSIEGPSEESRMILNPLLLFETYFVSPSIWQKDFAWKVKEIPKDLPPGERFPLTCPPEGIEWYADEARAVVRYDVSAWLKAVNRWAVEPWLSDEVWVDILGINARDMGLEWVYPDLDRSRNMEKKKPPQEAWRLLNFIHRGGSCRYPGGCNNGSPYQEPLDHYHITELPAKLEILLWDEEPKNTSAPPDFLWEIEFR